MTTLTTTQLTDMQADLGIDDTAAVFTDAELQRLYDRADGDYSLAVYYGWRQLLGASAKYIDYKVAQTSISRSQAFQHIKDMVTFWGDESRTNANQVKIAGMVSVPTKHKPQPGEDYAPSYKRNRSHAAEWP